MKKWNEEGKEVPFTIIMELLIFVAGVVGYRSKSPRNYGQLCPRTMAIDMGLVCPKTWENKVLHQNKTGHTTLRIDVRDWAHTFAMGEHIRSIDEWFEFAKTLNVGPQAKAILLAEAFVSAMRAEGMRLDQVPVAWLRDVCCEAGVDVNYLYMAHKGYRMHRRTANSAETIQFCAYESLPFPKDFLDRNLEELQGICRRIGKRASSARRDDTSQDMWWYLLTYGGWVVVSEQAKGSSDEEILRRLGGYLRACTDAVRSKYYCKGEVAFQVGDDYREDADKRLADPAAQTEEQAIFNSLNFEDLCAEYGVDPETARELVKKRILGPA